jgi:hypothetical protein
MARGSDALSPTSPLDLGRRAEYGVCKWATRVLTGIRFTHLAGLPHHGSPLAFAQN